MPINWKHVPPIAPQKSPKENSAGSSGSLDSSHYTNVSILQSLTDNVSAVVNFWSDGDKIASPNFTIGADSRYTAPATGVYLVGVSVTYTCPTADQAVGWTLVTTVTKNGTTLVYVGHSTGTAVYGTVTHSASFLVSMTAGQALRIGAYQLTGGSIPITTGKAFFSVRQVS